MAGAGDVYDAADSNMGLVGIAVDDTAELEYGNPQC